MFPIKKERWTVLSIKGSPLSFSQKTALSGVLTALALGLSYLEHFIPLDQIVFVPGIKLGLGNLVTVFALYYLGKGLAFCILLCRCLMQAVLFGTLSSFLFSISGGMLALFGMWLIFHGYPKYFSLIGICIGGAALHHCGQIVCAAFYFQSPWVFSYLPVLLLLSIPTGCLTGGISLVLFQKFDKIFPKRSQMAEKFKSL